VFGVTGAGSVAAGGPPAEINAELGYAEHVETGCEMFA
jgi:hypothetical protein